MAKTIHTTTAAETARTVERLNAIQSKNKTFYNIKVKEAKNGYKIIIG